jgi:hypothetical protein
MRVRVTTVSPIGQRIAIINIIPLEFYGLHYDIPNMINCLSTKLEDIPSLLKYIHNDYSRFSGFNLNMNFKSI